MARRKPAKCNHAHPLILQAEIERLRSTRDGEWQALLDACEPLRDCAEKLQTLRFRAQVGKSASVAQIGGYGFSDGTVDYGTTVLHSPSHVSVKEDEGRWGAAIAKVRSLDRELAGLLDPHQPKKKDLRVTCGDKKCAPEHRWRKQPVDSRFCRWCGRSFIEEKVG